jgi:FMNH2-dependent dimethyl sulfone monooxygenase
VPHFGQQPVTAEVLRGPYEPGGQPETRSGQPLELGLFAWNIQGGATASKAVLSDPGRFQTHWHWPSASSLITEAERIGFDYQVPFARWIGQGGETQWNDALLESLTAASAVAPITNRMATFSTAHCTYDFHPLHFAKFGATIDHISGGRWGLNIVAGYSAKEFAAFGHLDPLPHDEAYHRADEFTTLMKYLWTSDSPVTYEGEYYQAYGAYVNPQPTRKPRPILMQAGQSDIGIDFACRHVDWLFCIQPDIEGYKRIVRRVHDQAATYDRHVRIATQVYPIMARTDAEAQSIADWIAEEVDRVATMNFIDSAKRQSVSQTYGWDAAQEGEDPWGGIGKERFLRMAMGIGAHQLIGGYETVAEELRQLHEAGLESVLMSFWEPRRGLHQMEDDVIPLLKRMGLRN